MTKPPDAPGRLAPLPPADWSDDTRRLLSGTLDPVAELEGSSEPSGPLNILRTIAHHPTLLEPFLGFATALATRGVLARRESELLALRTAWRCQSPFEWGHHVVYGRGAGLAEAEIEALARPVEDGPWEVRDRLLVEAADALQTDKDLPDGLWADLAEHFDAAQLVEIPFVVGQYTMLSMVANATAVPVEGGLPELPGPAPD